MTVWIFGAKLQWLPLTVGCVKMQLPALSSRVRHNGERVPDAILAPVSIWLIVIMLEAVTYSSPKNNLLYVYGDWWFHINYLDSEKSIFLH